MPFSPPPSDRNRKLLSFINNFGGLAALWLLDIFFGHRVAMELTLLFIVGDLVWHLIRREPLPAIWWIVNGLMGVFIASELLFGTERLAPFEGPATDIMFAVLLLAGGLMKPPFLQRVAEQQPGAQIRFSAEQSLFLRYIMFFWSGVFWIVAAVDALLSFTGIAGSWTGIISTFAPFIGGAAALMLTRRYGQTMFLKIRRWQQR